MKKLSPAFIGAFVVGGVILTVAAVLVLGAGRFFSHSAQFILYFPGQVDGLRVGAPVRFKGVDIGRVSKIMLQYDQPPQDRHIPVFITLDLDEISSAGGWADLSPERVSQAVDRGLRAQLQTESLLTGLLFVQLDFQPDTPARFIGLRHEVPEIPTLPTALEQIQLVVRRLLDKLEHLDIEGLTKNVASTVEAVDKLVNAPELKEAIVSLRATMESLQKLANELSAHVDPAVDSIVATADRAQRTLAQLDATLEDARLAIAPDSPLADQIGSTLQDLAQAARSFRALSNSIERDPSVLLRGRTTEGRNP